MLSAMQSDPSSPITTLLSQLINHNIPNQSKPHFLRYCQRLLNSRFITALAHTDWAQLTNTVPAQLAAKLDSSRHFAIIYFLTSIKRQPLVPGNLVKQPVTVASPPITKDSSVFIQSPPLEQSSDELVITILYSFIGVMSKHLTKKDEIYHLSIPNLPLPIRHLVTQLLQLSNLYDKISGFVKANIKTDGIILQAFCAELANQLTDYYSNVKSNNKLSLRRLYIWTREPLQRLTILGDLVTSAGNLKGGALLSKVYEGARHGDPIVSKFVTHLTSQIAKPFLEMIRRWMLDGTCEDAHDEFCIAIDKKIAKEDLWKLRDSIRVSMVPSFLNESLVKKIHLVGKSLNFIRNVCGETDFGIVFPKLENAFEFGNIAALHKLVDRLYKLTNSRLLDMMFEKYKLYDHLLALKKYMLLGQGDFVQCLLVGLEPHLSRPARLLFRHNLTGTLESAIRSSNSQFDDPDILKRLDIELLEHTSSETGWDAFCLTYATDSPIDTMIDKAAVKAYAGMFCFLWKIKRVEYALTCSWSTNMRQTDLAITGIQSTMHECRLVCNEMIHFVYQLQYYFQFEVVECSWSVFEDALKSRGDGGDYEALVEAHRSFLMELRSKGFQDSQHKDVLKKLNVIFKAILAFTSVRNALFQWAVDQVDRASFDDSYVVGACGVERESVATLAKEFKVGGVHALKLQKA